MPLSCLAYYSILKMEGHIPSKLWLTLNSYMESYPRTYTSSPIYGILYSYAVNATILFENHTKYFDHKGSSSGVTIHAHIYQTATLAYTFTYMYLSSAYNSLVSGFVGNTNIHPLTQVKIKLRHSLFRIV
jgi:hypothetical protein